MTDTVSAAKVWINSKFTHITKFVHAVIFLSAILKKNKQTNKKKPKENQSAYPQMSLLAQKKSSKYLIAF